MDITEIAESKWQAVSAAAILERHSPQGTACRCGRPLPCTVAERASRDLQYHKTRIALQDQTQLLPLVNIKPRQSDTPSRASLFARLLRPSHNVKNHSGSPP